MKQSEVPISSDPGSAGKFVLAAVLSFLLNAIVLFVIFADARSMIQFGGVFVAQLIINVFLAVWYAKDRHYAIAAGIVAGVLAAGLFLGVPLSRFACHWDVSGCSF